MVGLLLGPRRPSPPRPSDEQPRRRWRLCSSILMLQGAIDLDRCYKQPPSGVRSAALGKGCFPSEPADPRSEDGRRLWGRKSRSESESCGVDPVLAPSHRYRRVDRMANLGRDADFRARGVG
jgi:hypothetical protein